MKLAHALLNALRDYGAKEIFGIPGDFALPFFREIERSLILPLHTLSHEPGVGFAADAAARYRSGLSVAAITYGAGGLNMVNAVAQAYAEKSPVVVISGAPGAAEGLGGLGLHHQVKHLGSQHLIYKELTCAQAVLDNAATAPAEIARVLTAARELSRPVYIEFPRDMVEAEVGPVPPYAETPYDPEAAMAAAREIMARLGSAKTPALLLCVEVRRYGLEDKVAELAKKLRVPTATTFMARGILAETDAPLIGSYLGLAGDKAIRETIEGSDALLMLGVILCDTNFGVSEKVIDRRQSILAFDRTVCFGHHVYPDIPLPALVDALLEIAKPVGKAKRNWRQEYPTGMPRDGKPILPQDIATAVNDLFERTGERLPIASDMGDCLFTAMDMAYTELVAPAYYATMGPGVPMGIGLAVASGRRPLILVGDGAFQMTGWEIGNARRLGIQPIVLLFNNTAWGMLKVFQGDTNYNDLDDWRFADMAAPLGGKGRRVATRKELADALKAAHADDANWHLIEVMIPRGEYSRTLSQFVAAVRRRSVLSKG
ncbi:MAG: indolepyruvate/phenylpyruvate decarboxylase [Hyphomicrobiales bacterium]|nr:indolepyruvate/phenylpyruvate decarboxylase [Hyphomicrobiales bacterium]